MPYGIGLFYAYKKARPVYTDRARNITPKNLMQMYCTWFEFQTLIQQAPMSIHWSGKTCQTVSDK